MATSTFVSRGRRGNDGTGLGLVNFGHRGAAALLRGRCGAWRHPPSFHVACMALGDIHLRFTWQVWHLATSTFVSRGRRGAWRHPFSFHVAAVALDDIEFRFAWQAWHLATSTFVLRGTLALFGTHTHLVTHTHIFHTHTQLCHTHTHLSHTHTTLSHTIFHTQL